MTKHIEINKPVLFRLCQITRQSAKCLAGRILKSAGTVLLVLISCLFVLPAEAAATAGDPGGAWSDYSWYGLPTGDWLDLADIPAKAWIVYDRKTGEVILEYQADRVLYPASTTKIMTAILALENLWPEQETTVSEAAVALTSGSSRIGLKAGEKLQVRDLLAGLMLASGNDAANVLAETMDGSLTGFAERMNAKAVALGMTQTNFCNPSGLHHDAHVSTARDLALLADYAMDNRQFREIAGLKTYVMPATNRHPYLGWALLVNSNRLTLFDDTALGSTVINHYSGIKTGTTHYAGSCLVGAAELVDGRELISVVLGMPSRFDLGSSFSVTHTLMEEAARLVLADSDRAQLEPTRPAASTPMPSAAASPTPMPSAAASPTPVIPAETVQPADPGQTEYSGFAAFLRHNAWRTAFIGLTVILLIRFIWNRLRMIRLRDRRRRRTGPVRPRRVDRP